MKWASEMLVRFFKLKSCLVGVFVWILQNLSSKLFHRTSTSAFETNINYGISQKNHEFPFCKSEWQSQSCFCYYNTFFTEHLWKAASWVKLALSLPVILHILGRGRGGFLLTVMPQTLPLLSKNSVLCDRSIF